MNPVLETTKFVVENSKHVKINKDKIDEFAKTFTHEHIKHWWSSLPFDLSHLTDDEKLHYVLFFNTQSFCYWGEPKWTVEYQRKISDGGSIGMMTCIKRAIEEGKPILDPKFLANITREEFADILRANVEIPLFNERLTIIREVGSVLVQKYDANFGNVVREAKGDTMKLLQILLDNFPSFSDSSMYKGKKVFFNKRAQLMISDIYQVFNGKSYGDLKNYYELTACADYKLPQTLRKLGIFEYSPELTKKIDNKIQIPKDSEEEIEIRANTVWAVEIIKEKVKEKIPDIDSIHVNDHLWMAGGKIPTTEKPYHRTLTTAY